MGRRVKQWVRLYGASIMVYGGSAVLVMLLNAKFAFLDGRVITILFGLLGGYVVLAPVYYGFIERDAAVNKPLLILRALRKVMVWRWREIVDDEKVALLFWLVKFFFLPLMIHFLLANFRTLLGTPVSSLFAFVLIVLFTLDTFLFAIGYLIEMPLLNNVVKSVEPTIFGWIVAVICYPPFNYVVGRYVSWGANDFAYYWNDTVTLIVRMILIALIMVYVWASFALGFKASNLTNRGIVVRFPYSVVRHPAYVSKNLLWWITLLPVISWQFTLGMLFWSVLYYFRAVTEERHLGRDPDYAEYASKVRWRFIPKVW